MKIEIDRETPSTIWIKGSKYSERKGKNIHDTKEMAIEYLVERESQNVASKAKSLSGAQEALAKLKAKYNIQ